MFITKKELRKRIDEEVAKVHMEADRRLEEMREREWQNQREQDFRLMYDRRCDDINRRLVELEKKAGLYSEPKECPYAPTKSAY